MILIYGIPAGAAVPTLSAVIDINPAPNTVAEDAAVGSLCGVTAFASHEGQTVSYSLAHAFFTVNTSTGVVRTSAVPTVGTHALTVVATSTDGSTAQQVFSVVVTAAVAPELPAMSAVIDANPAPNTVAEDAAIGSTVGVTALSSQTGYTITYSLSGSSLFTINPSTGVVTTAAALAVGTYSITALATSSSGSTASQAFTVTVTPVEVSTGAGAYLLDEALHYLVDENGNKLTG